MNKLVIIKGGQKHFLFRVLAAVIYAAIVFIFVTFFIDIQISTAEKFFIDFLNLLKGEIYLITLALLASVIKNHHFNLKENLYRPYYSVGALGYGKWQAIGNLEYVSIYQNNNEIFEVIIWDETNNRFKVSFHKKESEAIKTAQFITNKLNIQFYIKRE